MAYFQNLLKLARRERTLQPLLAVYYVTTHCNLNCAYCEDFGARRNAAAGSYADLQTAAQILKIIRSGMARLWLTGGEPLLYPHLTELLQLARQQLRFREITLISNGTLLANRADILPFLDRLVISLDSLESEALNAINLSPLPKENVLAAIRWAASRQKPDRFRLILNAVITPETLAGIEPLLEFCQQHRILLSVSPQSFNNWPHYELLTSPDYVALIERLIRRKKQGAPLVGSLAYLETLRTQWPYECFPTLTPRILPDGWLLYPCRPMEKDAGEQGGQAANLLAVDSWDQAWQIARQRYGEAPAACGSCFQQCYLEPSLMQAKPLALAWEWLRFAPGRAIDLRTYAPG